MTELTDVDDSVLAKYAGSELASTIAHILATNTHMTGGVKREEENILVVSLTSSDISLDRVSEEAERIVENELVEDVSVPHHCSAVIEHTDTSIEARARISVTFEK